MSDSSPVSPREGSPVNSSREATPLLKKSIGKLSDANANTPSWQDVAVCSLAYTVATLFVLSPLRVILGSSGSKHTVATTAVWFHPVRTQGNLIEVLYYTLRLLVLGIVISLLATASVQLSHIMNFSRGVNTVMLILWLSGALGFIGVMKVRAANPSFNTASSAAIIVLVSVLVREDDAQYGSLPLGRLLTFLEMVAIGAFISSVTSLIFYRKTSLAKLVSQCRELSQLYAEMLEVLVGDFGKHIDPVFAEANSRANSMLAELNQHRKFANYEVTLKHKIPWRNSFHYSEESAQLHEAENQLLSLQRQSMHLGGMLHCASSVCSAGGGTDSSTMRIIRRPMLKFATEVANFVCGSHGTTPSETYMNDQLIEYTHSRDYALRSCQEKLDNQLQAACILFAHLLQDLGKEMINGRERKASAEPVDPDESFEISYIDSSLIAEQSSTVASRAKRTSQQFIQLNEALNPTARATDPGLGPKLWKLLRKLRSLEVRHGIRVGLGAMVLSIPAFIPEYRPIFHRWHGEWAIITFMIIMARNLGAMTHNIPLRIVGTTIGALISIAANLVCGDNSVMLFFVGLIVSFACYRRILSKTNPVFGRFILLSYNLVCLYSFSVTMDDPDDAYDDKLDPMYDVAFHRVVSVIIGVLWAVFLTVTVWPHSARQALRANLCIQWMRMGMIWKSDPLGLIPYTTWLEQSVAQNNMLQETMISSSAVRFRGISSEQELQSMMLDLDVLLKNSPNEFRLRGKFDPQPYKQLLESTQIILDAFHSISILIEDDPIATRREQELTIATKNERRELYQLLFLQFYTASSSVRLGFPVPEYLPEPSQPLNRLAAKVNQLRLEMGAPKPSGPLSQANYDFVLFYSYMTVILTASAQLKRIHESLRELFGSLDDEILFAYV